MARPYHLPPASLGRQGKLDVELPAFQFATAQLAGRHDSGTQILITPPPSTGAQHVASPPPQSAVVVQPPI
jgi:hypothetical protein